MITPNHAESLQDDAHDRIHRCHRDAALARADMCALRAALARVLHALASKLEPVIIPVISDTPIDTLNKTQTRPLVPPHSLKKAG
ncbi:MAG: hypothetical protein AAF708_05130 [Deinococcota bacterium]